MLNSYIGILPNKACYVKQTETRTATLSLVSTPKAAYTGTVKLSWRGSFASSDRETSGGHLPPLMHGLGGDKDGLLVAPMADDHLHCLALPVLLFDSVLQHLVRGKGRGEGREDRRAEGRRWEEREGEGKTGRDRKRGGGGGWKGRGREGWKQLEHEYRHIGVGSTSVYLVIFGIDTIPNG